MIRLGIGINIYLLKSSPANFVPDKRAIQNNKQNLLWNQIY